MPIASFLTLLAAPVWADGPHQSPLQILAPADHTVLTDWSAPVPVSGVLNVRPESLPLYVCRWSVDGSVRVTGSFAVNGGCDAELDLGALPPGRHKVSLAAASPTLLITYQQSIEVVLNGTPEVTAAVEGSCVPDTSSPEFTFDVVVDDPFWAAPEDREIVLPLTSLGHAQRLTIEAELLGSDGSPAGTESRDAVTDSAGHYEGPISVTPLATSVGPYSWRIHVTDGPGLTGSFPADDSWTGSLLVDAPPVASWYDTVAAGGDDPQTWLAWSNDAEHSPYGVRVGLTDADSAVADIDTVLLTAGATGAETQLHCDDAYGAGQYCSGGGGDWLLELPTLDLVADVYDVTLLTTDTCIASNSLSLAIGADEDVDNDRDGTTESGVGPDHDCDDDDIENLGGADAVDAAGGNETDDAAAAMAGDTSAGFTAEGNLHNAGDVDWWAFEVSLDEVGSGLNAAFSIELVVPGDGGAPYGAWDIVAEASVGGDTGPDHDPAHVGALSLRAVSDDCAAGTTCTRTVEVEGASSIGGELYWWIGISSPDWNPAMCDDAGAAYALRVQE